MKTPLSPMLVMLLFLCGISLGQERGPEAHHPGAPTIVVSVALKNQTATTTRINVFKPTRLGLYRITAYMAGQADAAQNTAFSFNFIWTDVTGGEGYAVLETGFGGPPKVSQQLIQAFVALPGTTVSYLMSASSPPPVDASYTLLFTIEQLQ
jgi:hypothetical protein